MTSVTMVNTWEARWRMEITNGCTLGIRLQEVGVRSKMKISWMGRLGWSVITGRRWRVRRREWNTFILFSWDAVICGLLLHSLCGEGVHYAKDWGPVIFTKVVDDVVHILRGHWAPGVTVELLVRSNKVPYSIHFVCIFNLPRIRSGWQDWGGGDILQWSQVQGYPADDSWLLDLHVGLVPWCWMTCSNSGTFLRSDLTGKCHASFVPKD